MIEIGKFVFRVTFKLALFTEVLLRGRLHPDEHQEVAMHLFVFPNVGDDSASL